MASSVATRYAANAAAGRIERDDAQLVIVEKMTELEARIAEYRLARKSSALGWLFASRERALPPIKGIYIYGDVGRGKLYQADEGFEAREFKRTASRLIEMRSQAYLARPHGAGHERLSGSSSGIVET